MPHVLLAGPLLGTDGHFNINTERDALSNALSWMDFNDAPRQESFGTHAEPLADDLDQLRAALLDRLEEALHHPFPHGQVRGNKFHVGDLHGTPGKSLVMELHGDKRGLWTDFADKSGGDVFDAWAGRLGLSARDDFPKVIDDVRQW